MLPFPSVHMYHSRDTGQNKAQQKGRLQNWSLRYANDKSKQKTQVTRKFTFLWEMMQDPAKQRKKREEKSVVKLSNDY